MSENIKTLEPISAKEQLGKLSPRQFAVLETIIRENGHGTLIDKGIYKGDLRDVDNLLYGFPVLAEEGEPNPVELVLGTDLVKEVMVGDEGESHPFIVPSEAFEQCRQAFEERAQALHETNRLALNEMVCRHLDAPPDHPVRFALAEVDRADFVPEALRHRADYDVPIPIFPGMTESALHATLWVIRSIAPEPREKIMICGTKGGYLAAVISWLVGRKGRVLCLDWQEEIIDHACSVFAKYPKLTKRVNLKHQEDITNGVESEAPWDAVIVNGAIPKVPTELLHQLAEDGRLLFFLSGQETDEAHLIRKNETIEKMDFATGSFRFTQVPGDKHGFDDINKLQELYKNARARKNAEQKDRFYNHIRNRVPYPIAKAYMFANRAADPADSHGKILKAYEAFIKYLAICCLAAYDKLGEPDKHFSELLTKLNRRPTLGIWLASLRDVSRLLQEQPDWKILHDEYQRRFDSPDILDAFLMMEQSVGNENATLKQRVSLADFLEKLVTYRNRCEVHGAQIGFKEKEERSQKLRKALRVILKQIEFFDQYELLAVEEVHNLPRQQINIKAIRLNGTEWEPDSWQRELGGERIEPLVYLGKRQSLSLNLNPWIIWQYSRKSQDHELYVYENSDGEVSRYHTYHNSDEFPSPEENLAMKDLMMRHKLEEPEQIDRKSAEITFKTLMEWVVKDGVIDGEEMANLRQKLPELGIVASEDEVPQYIKDLVEKEYPGTIIEE